MLTGGRGEVCSAGLFLVGVTTGHRCLNTIPWLPVLNCSQRISAPLKHFESPRGTDDPSKPSHADIATPVPSKNRPIALAATFKVTPLL